MNANYHTEVTAWDGPLPLQVGIWTVETVTNIDFIHTFFVMQRQLAAFAVQTVRRFQPTWTDDYILDHVHGFVIGEDRETLAQTIDGERPHITSDNHRSIRSQLIDTPELFVILINRILQSNRTQNIHGVKWLFSFDLTTIMGGNGKVKIPEWVGRADAQSTWTQHSINGQEINCAAYAICYGMSTRMQRSRINQVETRALEMTIRYNWETGARVDQILELFTRDYPTYRITILVPGMSNQNYTSCGTDFEYEEEVDGLHRKPTSICRSKLLYLLWVVQKNEDQAHYAFVNHPLKALEKNNGHEWCHQCVKVFPRVNNAANVCPDCSDPEHLIERKKARITKPLMCEFCKNAPCDKRNCPKKCGTCQVYMNAGYDLEAGEGHRCIVRDQDKCIQLWTLQDGKAKTFSEAKTQIWVYDFESMITRIPGTVSKMFDTENHEFVYNGDEIVTTTVERAQHDVNMVVCMNIFDMGTADNPKRLIFKNAEISALAQFVSFALKHNFGKNIFIAHNGSGYDTRLVYSYVCNALNEWEIKTIMTGCKIMELSLQGKTKFRDSLLHLPGSLAALASKKGFNLNVEKGYFPHLFNSIENQNYIGPIPDEGYFDMTFAAKDATAIKEFKDWYREQAY
jgi:hypothetical protein